MKHTDASKTAGFNMSSLTVNLNSVLKGRMHEQDNISALFCASHLKEHLSNILVNLQIGLLIMFVNKIE